MSSVVRTATTVSESPNTPSDRGVRRSLVILLLVATLLLIAWSFAVPVFEAPDEPDHWEYAQYVHDRGRLPLYSANMIEANQPPLYYWLIAPVSRKTELPPERASFDTDSGHRRAICPPRFYRDCLSDLRRYWPIRRARLVTVLFSVLTIVLTYLAGYEATGNRHTGFLAGALVAFLPQFTFRGVNVSNDALVTTTSASATYFIIRLIRRGFSWPTACAASFCLALAFLSKISAIIFAPVLCGILLSGGFNWREKLKRLSVLLLAFICVLPWLLRNERLYGDLLASKAMLTAVPWLVHKKPTSSPYFVTIFPSWLAKSFVGMFGWMNVPLRLRFYYFFGLLALLAAAGCVRAVQRRKADGRLLLALGALPLLAVVSTAQLNLTFDQPQGRYLFPALAAIMVLAAIGLEMLPGWQQSFSYLLSALLLGINLYALIAVEWPSYWIPHPTPASTVTDVAVSQHLAWAPSEPLQEGARFGQTFVANGTNLSVVEVFITTHQKRIPSGSLEFHLRNNPEDTRDIVSASIPASTIVDSSFARFNFGPIRDSKGKSYYAFLDTHGIPIEYLPTVYISKGDIYAGGQFLTNDKPTGRDMLFRALDTIGGAICEECGS